eukprot:Skav203403  [mRNA]  locus=scaffold1743:103349:113081:- [translate_table: standard]
MVQHPTVSRRGLAEVLGHSVGEYAAAVVAGVLALEDAVHLIAQRGRLIAEKCEPEEVKKAMEKAKVSSSDISVAAVNGPKMTVISGRKEVVSEASGVTSRPLTVSHAFHSPLMQPMLAEFRAEVSKVSTSALKLPFFSTLLGREATTEDLAKALGSRRVCVGSDRVAKDHVDYWVDHVSNAVRFTAGMEALEAAKAPEVFLEIGQRWDELGHDNLVTVLRPHWSAWPSALSPGEPLSLHFQKEAKWLASLDPKATPDEKDAIRKAAGRFPWDSPAAEASGATAAAETAGADASTTAVVPLLERQAPRMACNAYPWREASHPLLRRRTVRADGATVFGCHFGGHVLALLSHHIVHGEVRSSKVAAAVLTKPWLLPDGSLEEPTELRLVIRPDGRLEVESEIGGTLGVLQSPEI